MTYSYKAELEAQYRKARSRVVALRAERDDLAARQRTCTTSHDHVERSAAVSSLLASTERELGELRHKLGLPEPGKPVKLALTAADRAALARAKSRTVKAAPKSGTVDLRDALRLRGLDGHGYLTKVMRPGCE
jgi:hypothetical protein